MMQKTAQNPPKTRPSTEMPRSIDSTPSASSAAERCWIALAMRARKVTWRFECEFSCNELMMMAMVMSDAKKTLQKHQSGQT
jgi:hypothetical protein